MWQESSRVKYNTIYTFLIQSNTTSLSSDKHSEGMVSGTLTHTYTPVLKKNNTFLVLCNLAFLTVFVP